MLSIDLRLANRSAVVLARETSPSTTSTKRNTKLKWHIPLGKNKHCPLLQSSTVVGFLQTDRVIQAQEKRFILLHVYYPEQNSEHTKPQADAEDGLTPSGVSPIAQIR